MKVTDIGIAEGHILVMCKANASSRPLLWPWGDGNWDDPTELFQMPGHFRVIPDAMLREHNELMDRQMKERDAFAQRIADMPQLHIDISVR